MQKMNNFVVSVRDFIFKNDQDIRSVYRIGKKVGDKKEGSYGFIRFCIHKQTGCLRAVKVIDKKNLEEGKDDFTSYHMANQEIEILSQVDHPGIMRMFEYFEDSNRFYIISDLYQGGELYDFIKDNIDPKDPV